MSDERKGSRSTREREDAGVAVEDGAAGGAGDREARIRALAAEIEGEGWTGSPLVVHGDRVVGGLERYEAARFLGMEDEVPRITLQDVFAEAGMDMPQIASGEGGSSPGEEMFQDYLRGLPRHLMDKYEL